MNDQPITADEQNDAAFRARLAPLASEVLPSPPRSERPPSGWRRPAVAWAGIVAAIAVLGISGLLSKWPWSEAPNPARVAARTDPPRSDPPQPAAPSKPATQDNTRASERTGAAPASPSPARLPSEAQTSSDAMVGLLVGRGDASLADGDFIGARLMFERAAALGSAAAAMAAGKTYDIEFLSRAGARGIRADQAVAAAWFRKAAALGDPEARARLARMEAQTRP